MAFSKGTIQKNQCVFSRADRCSASRLAPHKYGTTGQRKTTIVMSQKRSKQVTHQLQRNGRRCWRACLAGAILFVAGTVPTAVAQSPYSWAPWSGRSSRASQPVSATLPSTLPTSARQAPESLPQESLPAPTEVGPVMGSVGGNCGPNGCGPGGCVDGNCIPGRFRHCDWCNRDTFCGRLFCHVYEELCCPDPCYEGRWIPVANAAFFVEGTRPVTSTRIRVDHASNYTFPDRNEFFWARSGGGGKGPPAIETRLRYTELSLYQEVAAKGASAFVEIPYMSMDPEVNAHASGFGDMKIGAKALWFDRDLFQIGFMFKTYLPVGNFRKGLGTGHVSLEPSLLATLKITPDTYFESQLSEWIPLGGDNDYAGALLHTHCALNHVLCRPLHDVELIGTVEFNGYFFQDGAFSDPVRGQFQKSSDDSYLSIGPGLRLVICEWLDFGAAAAIALGDHGPEQVYRGEFRVRY
jgi:hypothetical protein